MPLTRAQLAFKALVALHEVGNAIADGSTVEPSAQLRFLLAYLHDIAGPSDGGATSRDSFDAFWRAVTKNDPGSKNPHGHNIGRRNEVHSTTVGIARRIGLPLDIDMMAAVAHALNGRPKHPRNDYDEQLERVAERLARGR